MISDGCITIEMSKPHDGPYDLEHWGFQDDGDRGIFLVLELGMLYDFYSLECPLAPPVAWELWHNDSAVMHVDRKLLARDVRFTCSRIELSNPTAPFTGGSGASEALPEFQQAVLEADSVTGSFSVSFSGVHNRWILDSSGFRRIEPGQE